MWSFVALAVGLLLTCDSASSSTVPLKKIQRPGEYLKGLADADRARAAFLKGRPDCGPTTVPAMNLMYTQYTTRVGIGGPPTYYNLIVDTGSSNTFCGTGIPYVQTSTSIPTEEKLNLTFGSGFVLGAEYIDQVTLAPGLVIATQYIGDALSYSGLGFTDGILGFGPVDLTQGTISPEVNATIPTVMDNLVSEGLIVNKILGVYFAPADTVNDTNGALTYGGIDESLYEGELKYAPLTDTLPSARYWGINVTSASYGNTTVIPESTAGIVDTGTTLVLLADDFFNVYLDAIPGARVNQNLNLIEIPLPSVSSMQPLSFEIAGNVFNMSVEAQLFSVAQSAAFGGLPEYRYSVIWSFGGLSHQGFDFILGQKFMERYYTVFDASTTPARVGFAQTNHTFST